MKKYVVLKLNVNGVKTRQSNLILGYPTAIAMLSFVENLKIKLNIKDLNKREDQNLIFGFEKFIYLKDTYQRKSTSFVKNPTDDYRYYTGIMEDQRANAIINLCFEINVDDKSNDKELVNLIDYNLDNMRIAGGAIMDSKVYVANNRESIIKRMYPCFLIKDARDELKYESVEDLMVKLLNSDYSKFEISTTGYSLLKKDTNDTYAEYEAYIAESEITVIKKEVMTNVLLESNLSEFTWNFHNTDDHIFAKAEYKYNSNLVKIEDEDEDEDEDVR